MQFRDRRDAGFLLGQRLLRFAATHPLGQSVVEALPRGGVPVGYEVARALKDPLEVFIVRKLGVPGNPELAMGAIASGGACLLNKQVIQDLGISTEEIRQVVHQEQDMLRRREIEYGTPQRIADLETKTTILVDDGAATGATMRVAIQALRHQHARRIVVALPTAASHTADLLRAEADDVIILIESDLFASVGQWYQDFSQTSNEEVMSYLKNAAEEIRG